jgi:hypothetical protein
MSTNLKSALHAAALAESLSDADAPGATVLAETRPTMARIRRRRAARYAGTSVVGVAAVAAIAVGSTAAKSRVTAPGGPVTALSERAGAVCDKPFDPAGKSDPGLGAVAGNDNPGSDGPDAAKYSALYLLPWSGSPSNQSLPFQPSVSPATAVVLKDGVVVGITTTKVRWQMMYGDEPYPTDKQWFDNSYFVPIAEMTNCLSAALPTPTEHMFDVVMLTDYSIPGHTGTALAVSEPVKVPHTYVLTTAPGHLPHIELFGMDPSDLAAGLLGFKTTDYAQVKDTAGATVPLYAAPGGAVDPNADPYTGPFAAHASGKGAIVITKDGVDVQVITEAEMDL